MAKEKLDMDFIIESIRNLDVDKLTNNTGSIDKASLDICKTFYNLYLLGCKPRATIRSEMKFVSDILENLKISIEKDTSRLYDLRGYEDTAESLYLHRKNFIENYLLLLKKTYNAIENTVNRLRDDIYIYKTLRVIKLTLLDYLSEEYPEYKDTLRKSIWKDKSFIIANTFKKYNQCIEAFIRREYIRQNDPDNRYKTLPVELLKEALPFIPDLKIKVPLKIRKKLKEQYKKGHFDITGLLKLYQDELKLQYGIKL